MATPATRKKGLAALLPEISAPVEVAEAPPAEQLKAPKVPEEKPPKTDQPAPPTTAAYLALQRKETRLREGQVDALTAAARELNRSKTVGGERITENTLIRVAVDLLLSKASRLKGSSEAEIRKSVGL